MFENPDYGIFFEFIRNYCDSGFRGINNQDHFMVRLNRVLQSAKQFISVTDVSRLGLLFCSNQVSEFYGIEPDKYDLSQNLSRTHPLDIRRRSRARSGVIETGQDIFINKSGYHLTSSNFRILNGEGKYINAFLQCYIFYSGPPADTSYVLVVNTILTDTLSKIINKNHYHWYSGTDLSYFRYPDEELLKTGSRLSDREFNILRHIHKGMSSKQISEAVSLSLHTINTHRRNILKKTGKSSIGEVIYELEEIGMMR